VYIGYLQASRKFISQEKLWCNILIELGIQRKEARLTTMSSN